MSVTAHTLITSQTKKGCTIITVSVVTVSYIRCTFVDSLIQNTHKLPHEGTIKFLLFYSMH